MSLGRIVPKNTVPLNRLFLKTTQEKPGRKTSLETKQRCFAAPLMISTTIWHSHIATHVTNGYKCILLHHLHTLDIKQNDNCGITKRFELYSDIMINTCWSLTTTRTSCNTSYIVLLHIIDAASTTPLPNSRTLPLTPQKIALKASSLSPRVHVSQQHSGISTNRKT